MNTKYKDLPIEEKESDKKWAETALKRIGLKKQLDERYTDGYGLGASYILGTLLEEKIISYDYYIKMSSKI